MKKSNFLLILALILFITSCKTGINSTLAISNIGFNVIKHEFIIILISLLGGILCLIGGITLAIFGFNGKIDWIVKTDNFRSRLINAAPGIILMLIGLFVLLF